ncbi:MAG TPA: sterol desaturase family protein [Chitinophagaceae bacterium]|nr:MAG: fatty acid hydroxylase [Bacteroidetes bacterium OLB11]HMN33237.1 sterol desaturase family protein [Chitinophagaceae bacterium]
MIHTISEYLQDNWLLAISTPIYTVLIALEVLLSNYQKRNFYSLKETLINFWLNIANTALGLSIKFIILIVLHWFFSYHFFQISNPILYWSVLFIGVDICFYFEHRSEHFSRILWAVHVTHHSSPEFNLTTGFRSSVFRPLVSFWFFIPLALMGFQPLDILLVDAICQIYGIMVHTRYVKKMPQWFETIFVSPSHHRVHHASNTIYLDKNMGMVLIIWDRMFGTFQEELAHEEVRYGITTPPEKPYHPIHIIFHEWKKLWNDISQKGITWKQRLHYIFDAPGWSHNQSSKTSKQLRKEQLTIKH